MADAIKNTVNSATDQIKGAGNAASKEGNKQVAKDSNASVGTRAEAAGDAIKDKTKETKHTGL